MYNASKNGNLNNIDAIKSDKFNELFTSKFNGIKKLLNKGVPESDVNKFVYFLLDGNVKKWLERKQPISFHQVVDNIVYIGKGEGSRCLDHIRDAVNKANVSPFYTYY